jgi:hypothetical protein
VPDAVSPLLLQFLAWVAARPRTYEEAMDAWRSSCPRLTVWDDAVLDGFIQIESAGALSQSPVTLTPKGKDILDGN